jgi:Tfp pilus assembly protein PilZ
MDDFDEIPQQKDVILKIMDRVLGMSVEQRLDLLFKLDEAARPELTLGERNEVRKVYGKKISFYVKNHRYQALCKDISGGGIFIQTSEVFHLGQVVTLDIPFSNGDQSIQVPAEIVRVDSEGIGLKFLKKEKITYL